LSDRADNVTISRVDDGRVELTIADRERGETLVHRYLATDETRELRLYLHGGNDSVAIRGVVDRSILVRIIAGGGDDVVDDRSLVCGWALGILPFPSAERSTIVYHERRGSDRLDLGPSAVASARDIRFPPKEEKFNPKNPDFGHDWRFGPWFGLDADVGLFIGGGPILYEHGFQAEPYGYRMALLGGYATAAKIFKAKFTGDFRSLVPGLWVGTDLLVSGLEVLHYYGAGNERPIVDSLAAIDWYRADEMQYSVSARLGWPVNEASTVWLGLRATHHRTYLGARPMLQSLGARGVGVITQAAAQASFTLDTRDTALNPSSGFLVEVAGDATPTLLDIAKPYATLNGDARAYLSAEAVGATLALRARGEKIFGDDYPYFASAFLGGSDRLRGYNRERFAGDASALFAAEVRMHLFRLDVLIPLRVGLTLAAETGRVWLKEEESKRWHSSYGGGLSFMMGIRSVTGAVSAMRSPEQTALYARIGAAF
jgi:hypothetical protein